MKFPLRLLTALFLLSTPALAATISGTITDGTNPLPGLEVRLWSKTAKGWSFQASDNGQVTQSIAAGAYTFSNVPTGEYKIDSRMGQGMAGNWGDRWYDVAPPTANGYVGADADVLTIADTDTITGIDIALELNGGVEGRVLIAGNPTAGILVRAEQLDDPRVHHGDLTQGAWHQGWYYMRGLPPSGYRVIAHEQNDYFEDTISNPLAVTANANIGVPDLNLTPASTDPSEPNSLSTDTNAEIDGGLFRDSPPSPFTSTDARIGPRSSGDVDWYCFEALAGDRYILSASGTLPAADGGTDESPWVDPVLAFWAPGGTVPLLIDDDSGPESRDALLDTGELAAAGRYCASVTTYGDTTWAGTNQGSAGRYALSIAMGNRGPVVAATYGGNPTPTPPTKVTIAEGDTLNIDLGYSDPENDTLTATWVLEDAVAGSVSAGSFNTSTGSNTFTWTAGNTANLGSPYTLTLTVSDGEFTRTIVVIVEVTAVNIPPEVPVLASPADLSSVSTTTPALVCTESFDPDMTTLTYEFELYYADGGTADQAVSLSGTTGGYDPDAGTLPQAVSWVTAAIPENTRAQWRVRAFDGDAQNGRSAWTAFWSFLVDVANDPPTTPELVKPYNGELVTMRQPTLSSSQPTDPEGDAITLYFEVSPTQDFSSTAAASPAVPLDNGTSTMWTVGVDLDWGTTYYARVYAKDARGGQSGYSGVISFRIPANQPPSSPPFVIPEASVCSGGSLATAPATLKLGQSVDPEQDAITIELSITSADQPADTAPSLLSASAAQSGTETSFDVSGFTFTEDASFRVRARAKDTLGLSEWTECTFKVDALPNGGGGGGGGSDGGDGSGNGENGSASTKAGCGCAATEGTMILGLVALARLLRRRRSIR